MFERNHQELTTLGYTTFSLENSTIVNDLVRSLSLACSPEEVHRHCSASDLNDLRLRSVRMVNSNSHFRTSVMDAIKPLCQSLLGLDLSIQRAFNLVISMPGDETSQIPLHADTWTGHSMFELVLWIPLTKVERKQSMYLLPLNSWKERRFGWIGKTMQETLKTMEPHLHYISLDPGSAILFWHHLPHGNIPHHESITRWSLNTRVKNLFTPYSERTLGDYFVPWTTGPLTKMVLDERCDQR